MTTFWRSGHTRFRMGGEEYVRGHFVCRTQWTGLPINLRFAEQIATMGFARARQYLDPNARCPVCHKSVYFFRHENGGCAWFDAVGKPWPIHPCMESYRGVAIAQDSNNIRKRAIILSKTPLALKRRAKCSSESIPLVMRRFENGKWKKSKVTSQQSESTTHFSTIFHANGTCVDCGEDIIIFRHPSGVEVLFSNFGPRWKEHLPASSIEGTNYNNIVLRRKRVLKEYKTRQKNKGSLGDLIEEQILGNTTVETTTPISKKGIAINAEVGKFWKIKTIGRVTKSDTEIKLKFSSSPTFVFVHAKSFYPKVGTPVFLYKKLKLMSWFNENTMEVVSVSLLNKGQSFVETVNVSGGRVRKNRRRKRKVKTNG